MPLSVRLWMGGGICLILAVISQTELNFASVLQVENASSYKQWNWGVTLAVVVLRMRGILVEWIREWIINIPTRDQSIRLI